MRKSACDNLRVYILGDGSVIDLFAAVINGDENKVVEAIESGADLDIRDSRKIPLLHYAALNERGNIIRLLLRAGADKSIKDSGGKTALDRMYSRLDYFSERMLSPAASAFKLDALKTAYVIGLLERSD